MAKIMLFLFLITTLQAVVTCTCTQEVRVTSSTIPTVVIDNCIRTCSCGTVGCCPSFEELQKAIQKIQMEVRRNVLSISVVPQCGDGLWHRVGYLNMSDIMQQCPQPWREYNSNETRACGRPESSNGTCSATFYPTNGRYRHVCGQIIGYQVGSPSAFYPFRNLNLNSINFLDNIYVDGVSVTHGSPRSHIWTYAAGSTEGRSVDVVGDCPCHYDPENTKIVHAPNNIRNSTYCESGNGASVYNLGFFYGADPLWDGKQCEHQCCSISGQSPPWFSVQLPHPTTDDIEVRICGDQDTHDEDNPISLLELYIQ